MMFPKIAEPEFILTPQLWVTAPAPDLESIKNTSRPRLLVSFAERLGCLPLWSLRNINRRQPLLKGFIISKNFYIGVAFAIQPCKNEESFGGIRSPRCVLHCRFVFQTPYPIHDIDLSLYLLKA